MIDCILGDGASLGIFQECHLLLLFHLCCPFSTEEPPLRFRLDASLVIVEVSDCPQVLIEPMEFALLLRYHVLVYHDGSTCARGICVSGGILQLALNRCVEARIGQLIPEIFELGGPKVLLLLVHLELKSCTLVFLVFLLA